MRVHLTSPSLDTFSEANRHVAHVATTLAAAFPAALFMPNAYHKIAV
jgi:hypothetical protein